MMDEDNHDLSAIETLLAGRLSAIRRRKERLRRRRVEAGLEERGVTDHAVIRYLERVKGVDIEAIRAELRQIASEAVQAKDGEHHWHAETGTILILEADGRIVTILSREQAEKWTGRKMKDGTVITAEDFP